MWQKDPLSKRDYGPLSGIESGRISANRARFGGIFHANWNGVVYGYFPGRDWIGKWEYGAGSGLFRIWSARPDRCGLFLRGRVLGIPYTGHLTRDRSDTRDGSVTCDRYF